MNEKKHFRIIGTVMFFIVLIFVAYRVNVFVIQKNTKVYTFPVDDTISHLTVSVSLHEFLSGDSKGKKVDPTYEEAARATGGQVITISNPQDLASWAGVTDMLLAPLQGGEEQQDILDLLHNPLPLS